MASPNAATKMPTPTPPTAALPPKASTTRQTQRPIPAPDLTQNLAADTLSPSPPRTDALAQSHADNNKAPQNSAPRSLTHTPLTSRNAESSIRFEVAVHLETIR